MRPLALLADAIRAAQHIAVKMLALRFKFNLPRPSQRLSFRLQRPLFKRQPLRSLFVLAADMIPQNSRHVRMAMPLLFPALPICRRQKSFAIQRPRNKY